MTATHTKKKTVAFYEVFNTDGSTMDVALPWDAVLGQIAGEAVNDRCHMVGNVAHWGKTYPFLDAYHFVLARNREDGVPSLDVVTDEIIDNENDVKRPWVEISVASFIPNSNRFGYVLGSQAAPRPSSMAAWINSHNSFDMPISIGPVISQNVLARLNGAAQAKLLRVKLTRDQIAAAQQANGLYSAGQALTEDFGDVEVELIVRVAGRVDRAHDEERISILDAARGLLTSDFKDAVAELLNFDAQGSYEIDPVNLLHDRLSKKMDVSVTDQEGNSVRIQSAVTAILRAADILQDELG
jgi:hypothetical protein